MADPLGEYERKRDFARTSEPPPAPAKRRGRDGVRAPVFVVHRHEARQLHYDLRLEVGGALRSWAVPKGFSYDPADKRLAVQTEDHPLEYEDFHGVIPKGEYGAGTMTIWDRGHYTVLNPDQEPSPFESELKILLYGRRLRGEWHLVKTKGGPKHWLLFKSRDRYAGPPRDSALGVDLTRVPEKAVPRRVERMRWGAEVEPFSHPDWVFEAEFAGRRALLAKEGDRVSLRGLRARLAGLEEDARELRAENALLDGVLVCTDEEERPSAELLEERLRSKEYEGLVFYAFDLLHWDDFDLRGLPLLDRKAALRSVIPPLERVLFTDHVPGNGEELLDAVRAAGLPAVVAKRANAPYRGGAGADWRRVSAPGGKSQRSKVSEALDAREPAPTRVKISNPEKVYWPAEGFTKGDLLRYYETVAETLLPYLHERPIHLFRFPDGIEGKSFYQKEAKEGSPDWLQTIDLPSRHRGAALRYMVCNDRDSLLYLVNLGSIDLHPWMSRRDSLESPDYAVIDLDPKAAPFQHVVRIAREVGKLLRGIGLRPLLKTSGASGLHIHVPLEPGYTYEHSAMFCESVARIVAREHSEIATVERVIGSRGGRVYIDYGQNKKGQTIVPPYVPRPVRGASVSAPLDWDELDGDLTPLLFTIQTMPERLEARGDLFRGLFTDRQGLLPAIEALEEIWRG